MSHTYYELNIGDANYPRMLSAIPNPPKTLYVKGNDPCILNGKLIGIVGTRRPTPYGEQVVKHYVNDLRTFEVAIVSGFMTGVDMLSHTAAIEHSLPTIAVLPCGINYKYDAGLENVYNRILANGGCVLSEYPGETSAKKWTFLKRNRIVAGLCLGLIVVEAAENSGSLITANYANSFHRKVFAVPGNIFSDKSAGTNLLLSTYGITALSGASVAAALGLTSVSLPIDGLMTLSDKDPIILLLRAGPLYMDEIAQRTEAMHIGEISQHLAYLSVEGKVLERGGKFYAL